MGKRLPRYFADCDPYVGATTFVDALAVYDVAMLKRRKMNDPDPEAEVCELDDEFASWREQSATEWFFGLLEGPRGSVPLFDILTDDREKIKLCPDYPKPQLFQVE